MDMAGVVIFGNCHIDINKVKTAGLDVAATNFVLKPL
jgi:hypothetical protein